MKTPKFWFKNRYNLLSLILLPLSLFWILGTLINKIKFRKISKCKVPVICIGNITAGGSGKTPITIALAKLFKKQNKNVHIIYKAFNVSVKNNCMRVNIKDSSLKVGDEPLILAKAATTWICKKRQYGINKAINSGADIILLDDGLQDDTIHKDYSIMVINEKQGFGNRHLIPAGPLRCNIKSGLKKADCIFFYGTKKNLKSLLPNNNKKIILVRVRTDIKNLKILANKKFTAFAGIAYPGNFYDLLKKNKINIIHKLSYPDHYKYKKKDLEKIINTAKNINSSIITTEKDYVKLPYYFKKYIYKLQIVVDFDMNSFLNHFRRKINDSYK